MGAGNAEGSKIKRGYLTITNNGSTADRLSCVSSDASAKCQVHTMTMENGVMKMRPAEGGLVIKPGETVMLKPSSAHLTFLDLKHPLEQGKTVAATLQFERAGTPRWSSHRRDRSVGPRRCGGPGSTDDARRRHNTDEALDPNSADCHGLQYPLPP